MILSRLQTKFSMASAFLLIGNVALAATADEPSGHSATVIQGTAAGDTPIQKSWTLQMPIGEKVEYRGVVNLDNAGMGTGAMMYPAPSMVGLLAAVLTHAAIVESSKNSQKTKLQEEADTVLAPYRIILDGISHKDLVEEGDARLTDFSIKANGTTGSQHAWTMEPAPVFFLTPDQTALFLENSITVKSPLGNNEGDSRINIRVIGTPKQSANLENFWSADQGKEIRKESARLFAESLNIALKTQKAGEPGKANSYKTVRYMQGNQEKMERAQIISEDCERIVMKNLREVVMSVPVKTVAGDSQNSDSCKQTVAHAKH